MFGVKADRDDAATGMLREATGFSHQRRLRPSKYQTVDAKRLHSQLGSLLAQLETAGVETLHLVTRRVFGDLAGIPPASQPQRREMDRTGTLDTGRGLYELGVRMVYTVEPPGESPGEVVVGVALPAGSTGASVIVAAVDHLANLPDNASKLQAASGHAERHLFVWAEHTRFELVAALCDGGRGIAPPQVAPLVPDFVDAVWLATACSPSTVWCYRRDGGWGCHGSVEWR